MSSKQTAMRGLSRCFEFTKAQYESDSTIYFSTVQALKEIRDCSSLIAAYANDCLGRVGEAVPEITVCSSNQLTSNSETESILAELNDLKEQLQRVTQAVPQAAVHPTLQGNPVASSQTSSQTLSKAEAEFKKKDSELSDATAETNKLQDNSYRAKQTSNALEAHVVSPPAEVIPSRSKPKKKQPAVKDFKSVLRVVANQPREAFSSDQLYELSNLCSQFFDVRFSGRNKCRFSPKEFRNYLISFILAYNLECHYGESRKFLDDCSSWVRSLNTRNCEYTLPKQVAGIYFNVINYKTRKEKCFVLEDVWENSKEIWDEFWQLGYNQFNEFDYECWPDAKLNWLFKDSPINIRKRGDFSNESKSVDNSNKLDADPDSIARYQEAAVAKANRVLTRLRNLHRFSSYQLIQPMIQTACNPLGAEERTSLISYLQNHGVDTLDSLDSRLYELYDVYEHAEFDLDTDEARLAYLQTYPLESLELVEIYSDKHAA